MSTSLVVVLAVSAGVPLLLGLLPAVRLPGPLLEILAGVLIGPSVLGWVTPDATVQAFALLGLSFLLFLAGSEVDLRRFRGRFGRRIASSLTISLAGAAVVATALLALGVGGAVLIGVALLATSLGLVVPVLADADALARPVGRVALAGASAGEVAAVVVLSVGLAGGDTPLAGRLLLLALLIGALGMIALVVLGVEHSMRLTELIAHPAALGAVPVFLLALLIVRGLPALAFRHELPGRELVAVGLLQATSLPFLLAAAEIGQATGVLDPAVGAGLVAAGLVSVMVFPAAALTLLPRPVPVRL